MESIRETPCLANHRLLNAQTTGNLLDFMEWEKITYVLEKYVLS